MKFSSIESKLAITLALCLILASFFSSVTVQADVSEEIIKTETTEVLYTAMSLDYREGFVFDEELTLYRAELTQDELNDKFLRPMGYSPNSAGVGILIFVLGVLAGYLVDGVVIYTTGQSTGEWVASALHWYDEACAVQRAALYKIICNAVQALYATNSSGCIFLSPSDRIPACPN